MGGMGCSPPPPDTKVLVLGFDGMDPKFVRRHADVLPNLTKLGQTGTFTELETVMPPQSPVAWSTVITGETPGGHGVFDFVHRHPHNRKPFSSMAETIPPGLTLQVGPYVFPLTGGETVPLRKGEAFWQRLEAEGVPTSVLKMPTDFPPQPASRGAISGMGTPDMLGSFGTFQFFTDDPDEFVQDEVSGGEIHRVEVVGNTVEATLLGPENGLLAEAPRVEVPMHIELDARNQTARIEIGDDVLVLRQGDWSDWVTVEFELVPWVKTATGIVRLYLKQTSPNFKLYVSPINIDPSAAEVPVSNPPEFAAEIAEQVGPFYTQGMAEETKGLSAHILDRNEFFAQANIVFDEEVEIYEHLLDGFTQGPGGMMFYYFSTTDQAAHMLWGDYEEMLVPIYQRADAVVGKTLASLSADTTLLVISDHGFARFDRQVHLNTWLEQEGFLTLDDGVVRSRVPQFPGVDWSQTEAYAMGLNAVYFNRKGREPDGIVTDDEVASLKKRLEKRLLAFTDPESGDPVVERVYDPQEVFQGENLEFAPDLLVGFYPPYRMSPESGLGAIPEMTVEDNPDEWIADHCMSHERVPGVVFSNRKITKLDPSLHDVPVTVLSAFGVQVPPQMVGGDLFGPAK